MEETNKRYRCWKCQQYLSRSVYYRHLRRNGCSDTRKTTSRESQKQRSVDMEVESFHIGNDSNALCNKDHTSVTDSHLPDTSQETELVLDSDQETEVVLDSDHNEQDENFLFDTSDYRSPEGSECKGWFASNDKLFPVNAICLFLNYYQLKFHVPDRGMQLLISFFKVIFALLSLMVPSNSS